MVAMNYTYQLYHEEHKAEFIVIEFLNGKQQHKWSSRELKAMRQFSESELMTTHISSLERTREWLESNYRGLSL
jgi:hypothetical protein